MIKSKRYVSKLLGMAIAACMSIGLSASASADVNMNLKVTPNNEENYVHLEWNSPDQSKDYSYMIYSKKSDEEEFQSIPAKSNIKVLNIYPEKGNNLKTWMETNGYGKGMISVDQVRITQFNANPEKYLKDEQGNWKYDVIYEGAWDANNAYNLSDNAVIAVEQYIKSGRGFLSGHDTIGYKWGNKGLSALRNYFNIKVGNWSSNHNMITPHNTSFFDKGYKYINCGFASTKVNIKKKGLLTNYPWKIGDIGTTLTIPAAHSTCNFALGDIWMTFPGNAYLDNTTANLSSELKHQLNFYLTTWNNCAMIQTGNSNGQATKDEQKIIANTLFYLAQVTEETSWDDHKGQDLTAPTMPSITKASYNSESNKIDVSFNQSTDKGTSYDYYIEATDLNSKEAVKSETKSGTVTTGIKGYSVLVDNKADSIPSGEITTTSTSCSVDKPSGGNLYIHVAAVDKAGNISEVSHYKYGAPMLTLTPDITEPTSKDVKIYAVGTSLSSKIEKIQTPDGTWTPGDHAIFTADKNGTYTFTAVDSEGMSVTQSISISNIDDNIILDIEPEKDKIFLYQDVEADLTIDNIKEIAAEDIRIKYDYTKLQFLGMDEVDGIKIVKSNSNYGELRVILASQGINNVVFNKKTLVKLHFKGVAEGEALVDITKGRVSDGIQMEEDLADNQCGQATITIENYKDPSKDGLFTLLDLAIDGRYFGLNPDDYPQYKTDVVENGQIDGEDLLQIGQYMLENPDYAPNNY